MASTFASISSDVRLPVQGTRGAASRLVGHAIEIGVLTLVFFSPWAFGSTPPRYRLVFDLGVPALTALWGARMVLEGRLIWRNCPVVWCLVAFLFVGVCQLVPLPKAVLHRISPNTARLYNQLLPARPEVLPAGYHANTTEPSSGSTISLYPGANAPRISSVFRLLVALFDCA